MNKAELIEAMAKAADCTKTQAGAALDGFCGAVTTALKKGDKVTLAEFLTFRPAVFEGMHPYEAIKIAKEFNLSVIPVVDKHNHFSGVITREGLFSYLTDNNSIKTEGSILILEMEQRNYSVSEIARICESNDVSIHSLTVKNKDEYGMIWVTIKVNASDVQSLISTFERFNYNIVDMFGPEPHKEQVQYNYDMLIHYINL